MKVPSRTFIRIVININFGACKNEVRTQIKLGLVQLSILNWIKRKSTGFITRTLDCQVLLNKALCNHRVNHSSLALLNFFF